MRRSWRPGRSGTTGPGAYADNQSTAPGKLENGLHPARLKSVQRWYFVTLILAFALILLVRFNVLPVKVAQSTFRSTAGTVLDTLAAAVVTSLAVGLAYVFLFPKEAEDELESLDSGQIEKTIRLATESAKEWRVRARTANYFFKATLPWLTSSALQTGRSVKIQVQVLDPENRKLMEAYARFRSNHAGQAALWTAARVQNEIYAGLLQAALCKADAPRLDIRVGFSPAFWVMSLDISEQLALLTGQNKGEPALLFKPQSSYFTGWCDDFEASFSECRIVNPTLLGTSRRDLESPTPAVLSRVKTFFHEIGLTTCPVDDLTEILKQLAAQHHYG